MAVLWIVWLVSNREKAEEAILMAMIQQYLVVAISDRLQLGQKNMPVQFREIKPLAQAHVPIYVKTIL